MSRAYVKDGAGVKHYGNTDDHMNVIRDNKIKVVTGQGVERDGKHTEKGHAGYQYNVVNCARAAGGDWAAKEANKACNKARQLAGKDAKNGW